MKAPPFEYHRPADRAEALMMLASLPGARILAGGQSLIPMLNMRYAFIEHLIDINRVPSLSDVKMLEDTIRIGGMTRQHVLLSHEDIKTHIPIMAAGLHFVGHLHTRNRGTIGGSLAHMDPAAELMNIATVLEATIHIESATGARAIGIADYPVSFMTPQVEPQEMIVAVTFRVPPRGHGWSFHEFSQRHGDFAIVAVGVVLSIDPASGRMAEVRVALSGVDFAPRRLGDVERLLDGEKPTEATIAAAGAAAGQGEAISDAMASGGYRLHLATVLTRRAITQALDRCHGVAQ